MSDELLGKLIHVYRSFADNTEFEFDRLSLVEFANKTEDELKTFLETVWNQQSVRAQRRYCRRIGVKAVSFG